MQTDYHLSGRIPVVPPFPGTLTTFDAPKAGTGFNQGTLPLAITPDGVIMGLYRDPNNLSHGFLFRHAQLVGENLDIVFR